MSERRREDPAYAFGQFRLGVVVPPANPTVEPELSQLLPASIVPYITRLPGTLSSGSTSIGLRDRIDQYVSSLPEVGGSFGGMSLDATYIAHTAITYVVGRESEESLRVHLARSGAEHVFLATDAIRAVLENLGIAKFAIVSPYPSWLENMAIEYWDADQFEIVWVESLGDQASIYEVRSETVQNAIARSLQSAQPEALLLSGTGLPTLGVLLQTASGETPIISTNSCSAWYATQLAGSQANESPASVITAIDRWAKAGTPGITSGDSISKVEV